MPLRLEIVSAIFLTFITEVGVTHAHYGCIPQDKIIKKADYLRYMNSRGPVHEFERAAFKQYKLSDQPIDFNTIVSLQTNHKTGAIGPRQLTQSDSELSRSSSDLNSKTTVPFLHLICLGLVKSKGMWKIWLYLP